MNIRTYIYIYIAPHTGGRGAGVRGSCCFGAARGSGRAGSVPRCPPHTIAPTSAPQTRVRAHAPALCVGVCMQM